uniref:polyubiquitin-like n=1 Tax=Styela clava TaxID=7725 RepID=UPI00193ACA44|nr:polyubiquitin-like [Styela clava]
MKILLKKLDGWSSEVIVNEHTETVVQLKNTAIRALGNTQLTVDQIQLIFKGDKIVQEYVRDCGIENGDTVMVVVKERSYIRIVVDIDGERIQLHVEQSESVENVKNMIHDKKGFLVHEQVLMFNGMEIGNGRLSHFRVCDGSTVQLFFKTFNITVKDLNGKSHALQVRLSETVDDLNCKIKQKTGVMPNQQTLTHEGRTLQSQRLLREYGIHENSVVHLVGRLRGG